MKNSTSVETFEMSFKALYLPRAKYGFFRLFTDQREPSTTIKKLKN